jgi:dienelactone hydrolase
MMPLACVLLAACSGATAPPPDHATATWRGGWVREADTLAVTVTLPGAAGLETGTFTSIPLRAIDVPLGEVHAAHDSVRWVLPGDAQVARFNGVMRGDTLTGTVDEAGDAGTFYLLRDSATTTPLEESEVEFQHEGISLAGTIIWPSGRGPFPGIVFVHGSRAEGRWASRFLAEAAARRGIAALIYDKRGVGASTGSWERASLADLIGDASAAIARLRHESRVDGNRVGVHGHSQGGLLAPAIARDNGHVAFVIGSSAPGVAMRDVDRFALEQELGVAQMASSDRDAASAYITAIVQAAYDGASRAVLHAMYHRLRHKPWIFEPPAEDDPFWQMAASTAHYDVEAAWRSVQVPALLVYGAADQQVPAELSAARIMRAYAQGSGHAPDTLLFADADHSFRLRERSSGFRWPRTATGYPDRLLDWVVRVTQRRALAPAPTP